MMAAGTRDAAVQPCPAPVRGGAALACNGDPAQSSGLHYLAFVDGLRAVSILAVVAFHVGVPGVSGGFVGVDIFFVISGFLIIDQIKSGLSASRFSIFSFYAHRGLRILPPYLIMLLATYAVAPFILPTPAVYWDFLASAAIAPLMATNVVFYLSQGYFDISAFEKPLLHTWTLSVEEQFYLIAPLLLLLLFRWDRRRFGRGALLAGVLLGVLSLLGTIAETSTTGRNAAFYLPQWRAWEFVVGGLIGGELVSAARRLPRIAIECGAWIGAGCIAIAIGGFNASMAYPSWRAAVPAAGAALILLAGTARPEISLVRLLALRGMVAIGLVSYGWYLWHWPILSFMRIVRLGEGSLLNDGLGGGVLALALAVLSYRYVERPIGRWRKAPGRLKNPRRIVLRFAAVGVATAVIGTATALGGYRSSAAFVASRYGIGGQGTLDNSCDSKTGFAQQCIEGQGRLGVLVGDSHATVLFGTFAKRFDTLGIRLVSMAQGSCYPLLLDPARRDHGRRDDCARLIAPYEALLRRPRPVSFVIISALWTYSDDMAAALSAMISEYDPAHTRVLLIGPVPTFRFSSLECVVLSDRRGASRDRCTVGRRAVERSRASVVAVLKTMPIRFRNVRYFDPIELFCDPTRCRPFAGNVVFYSDSHHLTPAGADRLFDGAEADFLWLAGSR